MIDVQQGTYSRWENGTLEPSLEAIVKLAKLFDTTTDYLLGKTIYSTLDVVPHPITRIDLKKLKGFNKTELDDLKFAIVMNGIKNHSTLPKYLDELVSENNLDEEEQEILHTLFKEIHD
ncbi:helix-turn-helix domain-containing protein [Streptococcus gordonii]|uniref:helix-turn-helix domain-containing protein n=2 Tax=Streptococcus TaxID=1301 RepID=UPI0037DA0AD2